MSADSAAGTSGRELSTGDVALVSCAAIVYCGAYSLNGTTPVSSS